MDNRHPFERLPRNILDNIFNTQLNRNLDDMTNFARASPRFLSLVQEYFGRIYTVNMATNSDDMRRYLLANGLAVQWINYMGEGRRTTETFPLEGPQNHAEQLLNFCRLATRIYIARVNPYYILRSIAATVSSPPMEYICVDWNSCYNVSNATTRHFFAANYRFSQTITTITFPPGNWERIAFRINHFNPQELVFTFNQYVEQFPRLYYIHYT